MNKPAMSCRTRGRGIIMSIGVTEVHLIVLNLPGMGNWLQYT